MPKIYNTLSKKKEEVRPIKAKGINLFVCGPTVYDFCHLGHARTCIIFDCFVKYLRQLGFKVFYLQNITDLDDKIIARAREKKVESKALAGAFEKEYLKTMKALKIDSVSKYARATDYIKEIISQIKRLQRGGFAYKLEDGIYFDISRFKNYGKLSGRTALSAEDAVSRIDYSKNKRNRGDFCLWKISSQGEPGWKSPFGFGRPGWHIEDTAIAEKFFGPQYDIHGGGRDLLFPHHEAEISQMESISGKRPFVRYWMHTGFLTIDGQKMSKSLGNFIIIKDFLERYPYQYLRFLTLKSLWRSPFDYSESAVLEAKISLEKIEDFLRRLKGPKSEVKTTRRGTKLIKKIVLKAKADFYKHLADDFNTPKAFAAVFEFIKEVNKFLEKNQLGPKDAKEIRSFFEKINEIFGIIDFKKTKGRPIPLILKKLLREREKYRKKNNFEKADQIRMEIESHGFRVEDTKEGPVIKRF